MLFGHETADLVAAARFEREAAARQEAAVGLEVLAVGRERVTRRAPLGGHHLEEGFDQGRRVVGRALAGGTPAASGSGHRRQGRSDALGDRRLDRQGPGFPLQPDAAQGRQSGDQGGRVAVGRPLLADD